MSVNSEQKAMPQTESILGLFIIVFTASVKLLDTFSSVVLGPESLLKLITKVSTVF